MSSHDCSHELFLLQFTKEEHVDDNITVHVVLRKHFFTIRFCSNYEADALELLQNIEDKFLRYYMLPIMKLMLATFQNTNIL